MSQYQTLYAQGPFDDDEARAFYERFVASGPGRLAWFRQVLAAVGLPTSPTVDEIDGIVAFVAARIAAEGEASPPVWLTDDLVRRWGYSPYGAALADGLVHLSAEIYHCEVGAEWVYSNDHPMDADYQRPTMSFVTISPPWGVISIVSRIAVGKDAPNRWGDGMRNCIDATRARGADALRSNVPVSMELVVEISPADDDDFTWQLWVDEAAEMELGEEAFLSLSDRLAKVPGVREVYQEDREIFFLDAPGTDPKAIEAQCRAIVDSLSGR